MENEELLRDGAGAAAAAKTTFAFSKKSGKKKPPVAAANVQQPTAGDEQVQREYLTGVAGNEFELKEKLETKARSIPVRDNTFEVGTGRRRKVST